MTTSNQDRRSPWRDYHPYSWRCRVGMIVPPNNTIGEIEFAKLAPEGVSAHVTRMALHLDLSHGFDGLYADLEQPIGFLREASVDVIAYACTASSMQCPLDELAARMSALGGGVPAVSTAQALVEALRALGARRIAVATPYLPAVNEHERHFSRPTASRCWRSKAWASASRARTFAISRGCRRRRPTAWRARSTARTPMRS